MPCWFACFVRHAPHQPTDETTLPSTPHPVSPHPPVVIVSSQLCYVLCALLRVPLPVRSWSPCSVVLFSISTRLLLLHLLYIPRRVRVVSCSPTHTTRIPSEPCDRLTIVFRQGRYRPICCLVPSARVPDPAATFVALRKAFRTS